MIDSPALAAQLEARTRELVQAADQLAATSEVLRAISNSRRDPGPVLKAVAEHAARLCDADITQIFQIDGELLRVVASHGPIPSRLRGEALRITRGSVTGRSVIDRRTIHVHDLSAELDTEFPDAKPHAGLWGHRTTLAIPLLREGAPIGAIFIRRTEVRPFSEQQIALLETFADQAVIAIENVRLFKELEARNRELTEALEQQTATSEILRVISSSPTNLQPVMDAVAQNAARLCGATDAVIFRLDGDVLRRVAVYGTLPLGREVVPLTRDSVTGRVVVDRQTIHLHNFGAAFEAEFPDTTFRSFGVRTALGTPLLREGVPIGALLIRRIEERPFSEKQIALLQTFADQAVIAIENVRLFKELEARTGALSRSVGQLTALGEVGQAISSTLELETVLQTIVSRAVQLTGLDGGSIYEYDERAEEFRLQAAENMAQNIAEDIRKAPTRKGDGALGRTAITREPTQVPDTLDDSYQSGRKELLIRAGYRALLAVPLLREDHLLGGLLVNRKTPGPFAPEIVELLKTFATQSAMAIQNARLFREIADKGRQLEVASRHKSDFLASMSHELRTPLNAILGFNEMILGQVYGEVPTDMQAPLAQIQSSGKHLLRLINNVLDLAKIEAGRMELALADYSVQDTVKSVRSTLRPLAAEKGLEFLDTVPADIPLAYGDSGRITQCLMNLAGNSLKFTKTGRVEISVEQKDGLLTYRVSDTGIGIAPDKIDTVFAEFKQSSATIASEYGGTGLGLSISRKFIEMHGGRIWVESELGKGSSFIFEVPLRFGAEAQA